MIEMKEKIYGHKLLVQQEESFIAGDLDASIQAAEAFIKSAKELKEIRKQRITRQKEADGIIGRFRAGQHPYTKMQQIVIRLNQKNINAKAVKKHVVLGS
ncbi:hypothetical protein AWH48_12230 [Domibacillus aminovorans]|uniref:Uncharacterized protein n=1 Tax=Domibacillus aminovorans TaxID=29332 RepID=A0A177KJ08_9BACI|nr:hypothetical protein [Domibacillus aminovorans]OAH53117.1 hypothetical protein AWH48_12230 [Domibacillus aminovorans]